MLINLGKQERRIRFDFNAICDMEQKSGMSTLQLLDEKAGFNTLRLLMWAGLKHENRGLTLDMVGHWIQEYTQEENKEIGTLFEIVVNELIQSGALGKLKEEEKPKIKG